MTGDARERTDEFAQALRAAITARGLSLDRIRYHLDQRGHALSVATISYWQSGRSRPERATSLAALAVLEDILELPSGELSSRLPPRRRATPSAHPEESRPIPATYVPYMEGISDRFGLSWDTGLQRMEIQDRVRIGPDRKGLSHEVTELLVAERDGADRYPVVYRGFSEGAEIRVNALRNCHRGRYVEVLEEEAVVIELVLDRPLRAGEAILVEHRIDIDAVTVENPFAERAFLRPVRSAYTEVVFDETCLPLSADRYTVVDGIQRSEPVVIAGGSLHTLVVDFGPGLYGLRWTW